MSGVRSQDGVSSSVQCKHVEYLHTVFGVFGAVLDNYMTHVCVVGGQLHSCVRGALRTATIHAAILKEVANQIIEK